MITKSLFAVSILAVVVELDLVQGAPAPVTESTQRLAPVVQPFVDRHELAGAVMLVAAKDNVLAVETAGWADIAARKPMRPDCLFWIASESKPITATALMMLVDEGKVKVEDPVEKYLPEFKGQMVIAEKDADHVLLKRPQHPITVKNILSHTSGLPFSSPLEQPTLDLLPLHVAVSSYAMTPLEFEPDTKYQYANAGINTAGRIIEVVTGLSYEEFLDSRLFKPLGMKDTTFWPTAAQLERLALAYKPNAAKDGLEAIPITQLHYPLDARSRQPMPAGGLFSTAGDLARFARMILNGGTLEGKRYLSEAAVRQMTSRQTSLEVKTSYGLGWSVGDDRVGHGGAYATDLTIDRQHGLVLVWMVQHAGFIGDGQKAQDVFKKTARELFGAR